MAEIKVPAWPIPIHQTKLTMANPQATGIMIPNRQTPIATRAAMQYRRTSTKMKDNPKPIYQNGGVRLVRTMALILSVNEAKVWHGSMSGKESWACADPAGGGADAMIE